MAAPRQTIDVNQEIVDEQRKPTKFLESFLYDHEILIGTGSPEGVVEADPTRLYMDDAGSSGSVLYIKQTGTGNTGWIAV
jgi:hypothetical protein